MVMGPDGTRNQELLCGRGPAGIEPTNGLCTDFYYYLSAITQIFQITALSS
jgi:hypothetical protein